MSAPTLLSYKQAAQILGVHEVTVKRYVYAGQLPSIRIGRTVRIPREGLEQALRERGAGEGFRIETVAS